MRPSTPIARVGDLVGHRQQPKRQYEWLMVDERRLLVARLAKSGAAVYCGEGWGVATGGQRGGTSAGAVGALVGWGYDLTTITQYISSA